MQRNLEGEPALGVQPRPRCAAAAAGGAAIRVVDREGEVLDQTPARPPTSARP